MTDTPWEPPLAGDELAHLTGMLERLRTTFRWKADGLTEAQLRATAGVSTLSLGGLLKHLAAVEATAFTWKLHGTSPGLPWADGTRDWQIDGDTAEQLYAYWDDEVRRSRDRLPEALRDGGLDRTAHIATDEGVHASLRRIVCDLVEEYGRHTGHADLLRESIDGLAGEDPPPGWHARSGTSPVGVQP